MTVIIRFYVFCLLLFVLDSSLLAQERVILIHGLGRHSHSMSTIAERLKKEGFDVYTVDYDSRSLDFDDCCAQVKQHIDSLGFNQNDRFSCVGHSVGGLIAVQFLENLPAHQRGTCVTLGTPYYGSPAITLLRFIKPLDTFYGPIFETLQHFNAEVRFKKTVHPFCIVGTTCPVYLNAFGMTMGGGTHDCLVPTYSAGYGHAKEIAYIKAHHNELLSHSALLSYVVSKLKKNGLD